MRDTHFLHTCPKSEVGEMTEFLVVLFMSERKLSSDCVSAPPSGSAMSSDDCNRDAGKYSVSSDISCMGFEGGGDDYRKIKHKIRI